MLHAALRYDALAPMLAFDAARHDDAAPPDIYAAFLRWRCR